MLITEIKALKQRSIAGCLIQLYIQTNELSTELMTDRLSKMKQTAVDKG